MVTKDEFVEKIMRLKSEQEQARRQKEKEASKDTTAFFQDRWRERRAKWNRRKRH